MNLTDEEREALVIARKDRAFDTWEETKGIVECGYWRAAANKWYKDTRGRMVKVSVDGLSPL